MIWPHLIGKSNYITQWHHLLLRWPKVPKDTTISNIWIIRLKKFDPPGQSSNKTLGTTNNVTKITPLKNAVLLLPGTWQLESILVQVSSSTSIWVSSTPLIHIIYIYIEASSHSCCWSKLMEEGEKSQLIFGRNVAGNNFMHAKMELGRRVSFQQGLTFIWDGSPPGKAAQSIHTHHYTFGLDHSQL